MKLLQSGVTNLQIFGQRKPNRVCIRIRVAVDMENECRVTCLVASIIALV